MAKIRVYELAKKLNMTNKALLTKLKAMNIDVKSHMSSLEKDTVHEVKVNLCTDKDKGADTQVQPSVIRRRKQEDKEKTAEPVSEDQDSGKASSKIEEGSDNKKSGKDAVQIQDSSEDKIDDPHTMDKKDAPQKKSDSSGIAPEKEMVSRSDSSKSDASKPDSSMADEPKEKAFADTKTNGSTDVVKDKKIDKPKSMVSSDKAVKPGEEKLEKEKAELENKQEKKSTKSSAADTKKISATEASVKPKESSDKKEKKKKRKKNKKVSEPAKIIKMAVPPVLTPPKKKVQSEKKKDFSKNKKSTSASKHPASKHPASKHSASKHSASKPLQKTAPAITPAEIAMDDAGQLKNTGKNKKKDWKKKQGKTDNQSDLAAKKSGSRKRKSVVEGKDLYEKKSHAGKKGRRKDFRSKKKSSTQKTQITTPKAIKRRVKVDETIELAELAKRMGIKANEMIQKLMGMGVMVTVNQTIDFDTASLVAAEFEYEIEKASFEDDLFVTAQNDDSENNKPRPPVVTIMGHVDHGKTSLLDVIRKSKVVTGEAGGITQHIGAYSVKTASGVITFLDTPGHAAFTSMRARGAQVTDIVVLVVAADDGVMPQTIEAINHSKAANVPVVVAVNKMDKPGAEPDKVMRQLSEHGLVAEEWGGDIIFAKVSAKAETGLDELLEMILLQADVLELSANPDKYASGHVVEARLDAGRGPIATIIVEQGTLKQGQPVVCGLHSGKIRVMIGDAGNDVESAGPSTPVEIVGLSGVPDAGDEFVILDSEKDAKQISEHRMQKERAKELAKKSRANLEKLFANMGADDIKELKLIVKADVHGSIEALSESLLKLVQDEVDIKIVHSGTGAINESDVSLAAVSDAIIVGFNVRPTPNVRNLAKEENVDIRFYDIIYNVINDIKAAITGLMPSTFHENIIGRAEVRETFVIPGKGTIAGSFVLDGKIIRGGKIRLLRDGVVKCDSVIVSLKRFKDDAKEVLQGYECGLGIGKYNDIKVNDIIECYEIEEKRPELEQIKS
ncbi:MAG: translation initiation factor IF-2 [Thermodesulfobacteriota bacterium]|nr:translation initiation factor IF-2 [Thermodesulfobacteriota bacterium]